MAKKLNIDDFIKKGYALGPDEIDPIVGKISNTVYNVDDFNKDLNNLYKIYSNMTKFKGASDEHVKNLAKKITKDLAQTVKDIKELDIYINLIRKNLV